jgi:hypothetical protein
MDKMSTSVSNFPGPVHPIRFPLIPTDRPDGVPAGSGVMKQIYFFVAPPMSIGPYVTIMSYCGKMYMGVTVNEALISDQQLQRFAKVCVPSALEELARVGLE